MPLLLGGNGYYLYGGGAGGLRVVVVRGRRLLPTCRRNNTGMIGACTAKVHQHKGACRASGFGFRV